ncbi:hypothetical protein JCM10212_002309 [Sporobolomyces blumeae]
MGSRSKRDKGASTPPSTFNAFRTVERLFKDKARPVRLDLAFDADQITWDSPPASQEPGSARCDGDGGAQERTRGVWTSGDGTEVECWKVSLDLDRCDVEVGQSRWKGKAKDDASPVERDFAIVIPRIPGFVLFPAIVPPPLQRQLVRESLKHARSPNVTSLDPHFDLPDDGLWTAWKEGRGSEKVPRRIKDDDARDVDGASGSSSVVNDRADLDPTVEELVPKLRWSNVGYHYDWTAKVYDFTRDFVPLPPLIHACCRTLARRMDWSEVFGQTPSGHGDPGRMRDGLDGDRDWERWKDEYDPDGGIVNFYQLKDSLTGHTDHSEADAVRPLVSLSLGHSAIFLVGGLTKDVEPLAIIVRSGDGLVMSGQAGRRAYHGLPRVLSGTLPDYLSSQTPGRRPVVSRHDLERDRPSTDSRSASRASQTLEVEVGGDDAEEDWAIYGEYLERGARININVRSVL